jgi:hypothetical protein
MQLAVAQQQLLWRSRLRKDAVRDTTDRIASMKRIQKHSLAVT